MEFHIARALRDQLDTDELLFSYTGNIVFGNVAASRKLTERLNALRGPSAAAAGTINAGALFAMGLIDELNHALIARYRKEIDPAVLTEALRWFEAQVGLEEVNRLLLIFTQQFPSVAVYRGEMTAAQWLSGTTDGMLNREAAVEELMLLWIANINPAFTPFRALFADADLRQQTSYKAVTSGLPDYFTTRPQISPQAGSLLDALRAPFLASPDSLTGQLDFIRGQWTEYLGPDIRRVLLAIDVIREEDIAIWMRFHPPGPDEYRHGAPGFGGEGFVGDEFIGFEEDFITGPDGVRQRRYSADYQAPLTEYEAFSADQAWMPTVVMVAKSTYVWLEQLSKKYQRHIQRLDQIPDEELRLLASRGITALWLIGLWERSVASKTIKYLRGHTDAVASAYSLKEYQIADDLGGDAGYVSLRNRAATAGIRLASDMVPNHMGIDSNWVIEHPEWFLYRWESPFPSYRFDGPDLSNDSRVEIKIEDHYYDQSDAAVAFRLRHHGDGSTRYMYHGNDGTTFAWNDTAQLDYSKASVREHVIQTILHVARLFPIIRFDAAMVLAKRHVQRLWFPLPGAGGSIPSRAENAMSQEEFEALMPNEFWREVVDRVAVEVPGTLLLAEAFWLLEGYFVRTLGMHRVYNSAFMNMLRDEENAKYRSYLKKTIEFDPDILKRYVSFMSNPDERTAIDQFGSGDKYFGVCTLLATLPGLPMFGHGQIEGFTERYGMEFKRAKFDESANDGLVARHQQEIAPLLKNRRLFAESSNFLLYDFWGEHGTVDENVFAYSNRFHDERALILYNNCYGARRGTIHISAASFDKGSGNLQQRSLADGLNVPYDESMVLAYRDPARGLEYLRRATDIHDHGMTIDLRGYQYVVLLNWRALRTSAEYPWHELCDALDGAGVYSVDEAVSKLRLRPLHEALRHVLSAENIQAFARVARELTVQKEQVDQEDHQDQNDRKASVQTRPVVARMKEESKNEESIDAKSKTAKNNPLATTKKSTSVEAANIKQDEAAEGEVVRQEQPAVVGTISAEETGTPATLTADSPLRTNAALPADAGLQIFLKYSQHFFSRAAESRDASPDRVASSSDVPPVVAPDVARVPIDEVPTDPDAADPVEPEQQYTETCNALTLAAVRLPLLERSFSTAWPVSMRSLLPTNERSLRGELIWAPVMAWIVVRSLPTRDEVMAMNGGAIWGEIFDQLQLKSALAEIFASLGIEGENAWRAAAMVRIVLSYSEAVSITPSTRVKQSAYQAAANKIFWTDPDVRWLAGVNESDGKTYFNKEAFEQLISWLQLPALMKLAQQDSDPSDGVSEIETAVIEACERAKDAGYNVATYLDSWRSEEDAEVGEDAAKTVSAGETKETADTIGQADVAESAVTAS